MNKILVTGANGLVGRHLIERPGSEFYAVARRKTPTGIWIGADLSTDFDTSYFPRQLDAIICLAQSNRYRDLPDGAADLIDVNVAGVTRILQYAASLDPSPHVIIASTGDVYGRSMGKPFEEGDPPFQYIDTPGLYALSRKFAEDYASSFAFHYHLKLSIVRLFHIYGIGMPANSLIYRLRQSIQQGRSIRLDGEDGIFINPTYVMDAVEALLRIVTEKSKKRRYPIELYNVAGAKTYSIRKIAEIIGQQIGITPLFEVGESHPAPYIVPSIEKLLHHYGRANTIPFEYGFALVNQAAAQ